MDVSDLRKRILRALDEAQKDAQSRRQAVDRAAQAYEAFLEQVAVPLMRQSAQVLHAAGEPFSVHTPASSVRLVSDGSPDVFLEMELDPAGTRDAVLGRISTRGRRGPVVEEQPVAAGKTVETLTEEDVAAFLLASIPKLVGRH